MRLPMDLTPDRFYLIVEFFVAELQKFLLQNVFTQPQQPLTSVPKLAIAERVNCI